ncbi:peptidylprolyl isomerase [Mariniphaga sediminis]|uniref:peptidylprolyl isomerase n=1 Tax=Mariniphaga sediminis TaxID=1628158 RepID=UPI003562D000
MKKQGIFVFIFILAVSISCRNSGQNQKGEEVERLVLIKTSYGNIKVKLYEKTAEHRKNFEKLVNEGFYNGLLFHRVIENFMIQGGDPDSKEAQPGQRLGGGSLDYTLPAEFVPEYFHKKGALAAARLGGAANPEKRSSASQFYIVQGEIFSEETLDALEVSKNQRIKNDMLKEHLKDLEDELQQFRANNDHTGFNLKVAEVREQVDSLFSAQNLGFKFTDEQREIYTTIGGYPSLDGDYTVFGEIVEGMEVVEKIAAVGTDENDRPLKDVKMEMEWK